MGGRDDGGVLPRGADRLYGNTATRAETLSSPGASGTSCGRNKAQERPSMAAELQEHEALAYKPGHRIAARWNTSFRFALKNRARSRTHSNDNSNTRR